MNAFLKKIVTYTLCILFVANVLAFLSLWALRKGNFYKPSFIENQLRDVQFDYIVIGASTGLTTINTKLIDSLSGKKGINLSIDDTSISSQYLMLRHFLASGNKTKLCVLAPGITSYDEDNHDISANDYRFLPFVGRSYVSEYYNSFNGTRAGILSKSKYLPMLGVSYYNAEVFYPSLVSFIQPKRNNRFDENGNYTYPVQNIKSKIIKNRETLDLRFSNPALAKLKALCAKENIKLVCYISPVKKLNVKTSNTNYNIINHSDRIIQTKYFFDDVHVNTLGRKVTSQHLANDLVPYFSE